MKKVNFISAEDGANGLTMKIELKIELDTEVDQDVGQEILELLTALKQLVGSDLCITQDKRYWNS